MALSMLAELTDGESRAQILTLLGSDSLEALRGQANALWNDHYSSDGATNSILASSLWLDEGVPFNQKTLDTLAETYYASSFQGNLGTEEMNQALQDWLNSQTGGLLQEQIGQLTLDPETLSGPGHHSLLPGPVGQHIFRGEDCAADLPQPIGRRDRGLSPPRQQRVLFLG